MLDDNQLSPSTSEQRQAVMLEMGRCMLRLQQYEKGLKALLTSHEFKGSVDDTALTLDKRMERYAGKTLGSLAEPLFGTLLVGSGGPSHEFAVPTNDASTMGFRTSLQLPDEEWTALQASFEDFRLARNQLVHGFIDKYDLWTEEGCQSALLHLEDIFEKTNLGVQQVGKWAAELTQMNQLAAAFLASPEFERAHEQLAQPEIVSVISTVPSSLAVDGWFPLPTVVEWLADNRPEQTPQKLGGQSWRQVLHNSGYFEIAVRGEPGSRVRWFRARTL